MFAAVAAVLIASMCGFGEYDPDAAAAYALKHAGRKSQGQCAKYVRRALEAGGMKAGIHLICADQYREILPVMGFEKAAKPYRNGDVAVFAAAGSRRYGHIAILAGGQWVSDFRQRSFFVHSDYAASQDYMVFRKAKGRFYANPVRLAAAAVASNVGFIMKNAGFLYEKAKGGLTRRKP